MIKTSLLLRVLFLFSVYSQPVYCTKLCTLSLSEQHKKNVKDVAKVTLKYGAIAIIFFGAGYMAKDACTQCVTTCGSLISEVITAAGRIGDGFNNMSGTIDGLRGAVQLVTQCPEVQNRLPGKTPEQPNFP